MDDCLTGAANVEEASVVCAEMDQLLRGCGLVLDKWRSNRPNVVPKDSNEASENSLELSEFADTTVLGFRWFPRTDHFMYKFNASLGITRKEATKRTVLSRIAQIFDPMGIIAPVIVIAKILMQRIWEAKIGWDMVIPENLFIQWDKFHNELQYIIEFKIPRWVGLDTSCEIEVHGFSDASNSAYGAVLFIRVKKNDKNTRCTMVAAKSRVAPLKPLSIPRLELCAALILSELMKTFLEAVKLSNSRVTL